MLATKLRPVSLFKGDKMLLYRRGVLYILGNLDTDGRAIYNKYSPLTTSVWYLSALYIWCAIQIYFPSQKKFSNDIVTGGRPMTS